MSYVYYKGKRVKLSKLKSLRFRNNFLYKLKRLVGLKKK